MWPRRRKDERQEERGTTALAEPVSGEPSTDVDRLRAEIEALSEINRGAPDRMTERRLLGVRHRAGIALLDRPAASPEFAQPDTSRLPNPPGLPEIAAADVTPGLLRAGILRDGCLLVRGLVPRAEAERFAGRIERAWEARTRRETAESADEGMYEEFEPDPRFGPVMGREWIEEGGGLLAADSPELCFEMFEMLRTAGLPALVGGYLGEPALASVQKITLRKAEPQIPGAWHQDGFFMGPVRALNLWLALSLCGDVAPGLEIVPRRLDYLVTTATEEALLGYTISQRKAQEAAGEVPIIRPLFEPGDGLLFDELFLHQTGSDPSMAKPRFAIESWFFGGSGFPAEYAPLAV